MIKNSFIIIFMIGCGFSAFAQEGGRSSSRQTSGISVDAPSMDMNQNVMLARSSALYRVTPGDVYTLTFAAGTSPTIYTIAVDSSYRIRVANLGIVNGAGKTFMQLKSEVEAVVANNYPLSGVQLVLTQPAVFKVHVKGEVPEAGEVSAWGLSRLSSLVKPPPDVIGNKEDLHYFSDSLTPYASVRDVAIKSSNGQTRVYDLFKAQRLGDLGQDPYLRPGDEITFNRVKRSVIIKGEVERPGMYQLLDEENLKELIEVYGNGFTPVADKTRLEMVRIMNSADVAGDKIFLTDKDIVNNYALENYDVITVPIITQLQPVMFVEGAVVNTEHLLSGMADPSTQSTSDLISSNRLVVQFNKGETYASLVRKNIRWFTAVSDTLNAYVIRNGNQIPINLNPMLYDAAYRGEVFVEENDILVIPFRQYFITVAGAVVNPGRYPYIPDRDWEYYIALAGGFIMERNVRQVVTITDMSGKRMKKTDAITPETVITAKTNHGIYYVNQVAPVVATLLSIVSTFLTIYIVSGGTIR